ncbi:hypothetical protein Tco_0677400 [Tanacetum coccineum]|uniref:Uncharacterized protein n=1 Tax=Tanacetum coccineum TaxID=301880 RepID=A0ABQ4XDE7_9ASTR
MATGSQLNSSIRVSLNPNEDSKVPRVYETVTNNIQEPVQADGGPIRVSCYAGLFTSNSTTNATSLGESLMVNPSNVVESGSVEDVITSNLSGGWTRVSYPDPFSTSSIGMNTSYFPKGDGIKVATQAVDINTKPMSYAGATSGILIIMCTSYFVNWVAEAVIPRRLSKLNINGSRLDALLVIYLDTRECHKKEKEEIRNKSMDDGFVYDKRKFKGVNQVSKLKAGLRVPKGKHKFIYRHVSKPTNNQVDTSKPKVNLASKEDMNLACEKPSKKKISNIASPNPFAALGVDDDKEEEVKNVWDESENLNLPPNKAIHSCLRLFSMFSDAS